MDPPSLRAQICAARSVMRRLSFGAMCCPINFNYESMFTAAKIGKIRSDYKLSHEFESTKPPGPQSLPEQAFGLRVLFPQIAGAISRFCIKIGHGELIAKFCRRSRALSRPVGHPLPSLRDGRGRINYKPSAILRTGEGCNCLLPFEEWEKVARMRRMRALYFFNASASRPKS